MVWRTTKPVESDRVKNLGGVIRDNKSAFDVALQKCFYWSDSESSAGIVTSSATTGTARAFYDAASRLSTTNISTNTSGRLYLDSTNTRLYVLGESTKTTLVGSGQGVVCNYDIGRGVAALNNNERILVQSGSKIDVTTGASTAVPVSYTTAYAVTPNLMVSLSHTTDQSGAAGMFTHYVSAQDNTGFTVTMAWSSADPELGDGGFYWRAEGAVSV